MLLIIAEKTKEKNEELIDLRAQLEAVEISIKDREARADYSANCAAKLAKELESLKNAHKSQ